MPEEITAFLGSTKPHNLCGFAFPLITRFREIRHDTVNHMQKYKLLFVSGLLAFSFLSIIVLHSALRDHSGFATVALSLSGLPGISSQVDSNASTTPGIVDVLQQLQDQELQLTTEVADLRSQMEDVRLKSIFTRVLKRGDSGDDVTTLQTLLAGISGAATTSITTDFYGRLTEKAVKNFQISAALKATGIFDTETRNALISSVQTQTDVGTAHFTPTNLSSVTDPQQNVQELQDQISQLTARLSDNEMTIADLQSQVTNLESGLSDVQSNVTSLSSTPPAAAPTAQPLSISSIQAGTITKTSATIVWVTNNQATSEVDYSQNPSMPVNQMIIAKSSTMTTVHSVVLPSLVSGTIYYYRVISQDNSNTIANSSNLIFTTLH